MKNIYFLFMVLCVQYLQAQVPNIEWQNAIGGTSVELIKSIQGTSDGGYIIAGQTNSNNGDFSSNHGITDALIVKLSSTGTTEWQKTLGGSSLDVAYGIALTADGGYIVVGFSTSNNGDVSGNHGGEDVWVVKLSGAGIIEWQNSYGGTGYDYGYDIKVTPDGGYILTGHTSSNNGNVSGNHGYYDAWVVKLSAMGVIQWQKVLGGTDGDYAESIQLAPDGGYILAGYTSSNNGDVSGNHQSGVPDAWVVKLSDSGVIQWQKALGGTASDYANKIELTPDGGYILSGNTSSNNGDVSGLHGNYYDCWVVKLSDTGAIQWQKTLGGTFHDYARSIKTTAEGGYVITGMVGSSDGDVEGDHPTGEIWVVKLSDIGVIQWQKSLGGSGVDEALDILTTSDGGYIMIGWTSSPDGDVIGAHGDYDGWVVKLTADPLNVEAFAESKLFLYPNPAKSVINIQTTCDVIDKVIITDIMGKKVLECNSHQIAIEPLEDGLYFLQLFSGNESFTSKFIKE